MTKDEIINGLLDREAGSATSAIPEISARTFSLASSRAGKPTFIFLWITKSSARFYALQDSPSNITQRSKATWRTQ